MASDKFKLFKACLNKIHNSADIIGWRMQKKNLNKYVCLSVYYTFGVNHCNAQCTMHWIENLILPQFDPRQLLKMAHSAPPPPPPLNSIKMT